MGGVIVRDTCRYTISALDHAGGRAALGSHNPDPCSWLVPVNSTDSEGAWSPGLWWSHWCTQDSPLEKGLGRDRLRMSTGQAAHGGLGGVGVGAVQALRSQLRGERDRAMGVQGGRSGPPPQDRRGRGRGWT